MKKRDKSKTLISLAKITPLFLISFIILSILIPIIYAQDNSLPADVPVIPGGEETVNKITDVGDAISEQGTDYLKQEWGKILNKGRFLGPLYRAYQQTKPYLTPIFKYTIGTEFELSWLFFLTLMIWIFFLLFFYQILSTFSTFSETTSLGISIGLMIITAITIDIPEKIANLTINLIGNKIPTWWGKLIAVVIVFLIFFILSISSKFLKGIFGERKERVAGQKEKENRLRLQRIADREERRSKEINKALGED